MKRHALFLSLFTLFFGMMVVKQQISAEPPITTAEAPEQQTTKPHEMKILVLIVANDDLPIYGELQKVWRAYMHLDPKHVEAYFIKSGPFLYTTNDVIGDVIWCQTETNYKPGMINKNLVAMEHLLPKLKEFDYVIRTNLSSFYFFPNLFKFLETLPRTKCYSAVIQKLTDTVNFGAGAGLIFSPDVVELMVHKKDKLWDKAYMNEDGLIGEFLANEGITLLPAPRKDIQTIKDWQQFKEGLPLDTFHFRVKNPNDRLRLTEEIPIHKEMLKMYYNVSLDKTPEYK